MTIRFKWRHSGAHLQGVVEGAATVAPCGEEGGGRRRSGGAPYQWRSSVIDPHITYTNAVKNRKCRLNFFYFHRFGAPSGAAPLCPAYSAYTLFAPLRWRIHLNQPRLLMHICYSMPTPLLSLAFVNLWIRPLSLALWVSLSLSSTKYNLDDFCSAVCSVATRLPHSELEHAVNFLS